jgi:hypothetical protein
MKRGFMARSRLQLACVGWVTNLFQLREFAYLAHLMHAQSCEICRADTTSR